MNLPPTVTELDTLEASATGVADAVVSELFQTLDKAIRARRLYQASNPVYKGFVEALRAAVGRVWEKTSSLYLGVEENGFRHGGPEGRLHPVGEGRDNLAFMFYKDGIRYLTLLPGFEEEAEQFLDVVYNARQVDRQGDDLVTLLWEQEFASFQYGYVDVLSEGLEIPGGGVAPKTPKVELGALEADANEPSARERVLSMAQQAAPEIAANIRAVEIDESTYFLDEREQEILAEAVEEEWNRDLKADVLNALFDRLEDSQPVRQREILGVLRQLLPTFLSRGDLISAATILRELDQVMSNRRVMDEELRQEASALMDQLSEPEMLSQLILTLEDGGISPDADELGVFLSHLRPEALPILVRAAETTSANELRTRLRPAIDGLAGANAVYVASMLDDTGDIAVAIGAARLAGRLRMADAAPRLAKLLERDEPAVRLAAIEALVAVRSSAAMGALQKVLDDPDREVRVAAARGLGSLRYAPARARFEEVLLGRTIREADLTEKIAFFEAYGTLAGAEGVPVLEKVLNGKGFLGRRPPSDVRACAALGLGRIGTPAARAVLDEALKETDPVVRSAITRALRIEVPAQ